MDQETDSILFFLLKGKNESHDYTVSEAPISYDDLQEAYSRLLDGATGEDVFDYKEGDERQRRYLYFEYEHEEILEEYFQKDMQEIWIH